MRGCVVHMDALVMTCVMDELPFGVEERVVSISCDFDLEGCTLDPMDPWVVLFAWVEVWKTW